MTASKWLYLAAAIVFGVSALIAVAFGSVTLFPAGFMLWMIAKVVA